MYKIYCDEDIIYSPPMVNEGYIAYNAKINKELNMVDTAEFTIPQEGEGYDLISKLKSDITITDNDEVIFMGRCTDITTDFQNQRKFHCEGVMGFLADSILRPYSFSTDTPGNIFTYYLQQHNLIVGTSRRLLVGDTTTMQSVQIVRESTVYPNTLDELQEKLIEDFGGYVMPRYTEYGVYLDYKATSGGNNTQVIKFGENLLNIEEFIDASEVKTILIPLGATIEGTEDRLTVKSVNNNKDYIENATGIGLFGRIEGVEEWDDITIASNLLTAGTAKLAQLISEAVTLTINAIDLSLLDVNVASIKLGEYNRVLSVPHGIDDYFQCTRIELDLSNPSNHVYTFGNPRPTLTDNYIKFRTK